MQCVSSSCLFALFLLAGAFHAGAAEYVYSFVYSGSSCTASVFVDDSIPSGQVKGVLVANNYGGANGAYQNAAWRNFAKENNLALCLLPDQDVYGTPASTTGMKGSLDAALAAAATNLSHPELASSTIPFIFVGISRGGTSGAISLGQAYGANRCIACIGYHGNSFEYISSVSNAAAKAIPVLYPMAQLDSGPYRQTDIEAAVRTTGVLSTGYSFGIRPTNGLYWTTTIQYGSSHASLGDDTYPLQWLGRMWAARYNPATAGTLNAISTGSSVCGSYTLTNGASSSAYFASTGTSAFAAKNGNIWLLTAGVSEWIAESSLPTTGTAYNIDSNFNTIYIAPDTIDNRNFINSGSITFTGSGTISLNKGTAANKNYFNMTGGTVAVVRGVTLRNGALQGADWTNNKASLSIDSTSTFDLYDGSAVQIDALVGSGTVAVGVSSGSQTFTIGNNNGSGTFSGVIVGGAVGSGSIALVKSGSGTQLLTGSNRYTGGTTINSGTLAVSGSGRLGSANVSIATGAVCTITSATDAIADSATVAITGNGKVNIGAGVTERVANLTINGTTMAHGVWDAVRDPVHFSGSGSLSVVTAGLTGLDDWRQTNLGTTSNTGTAADSADKDGDGIPNLMEFATGTLPQTANTLGTTTVTSGTSIQFNYRRSRVAEVEGKSFIVEWSDTLQNDWSTSGVTQAAVPGTYDGLTTQWQAIVPASSISKRFVRLRIQ